MTFETLRVSHEGPVTLVIIDRPAALNALNAQVREDLFAAAAGFDADPNQRCLVISGNDKAFAAGADIKEMEHASFPDMFAGNIDWSPFTTTRKPVIAAVAGYALGGGCELAMMCDIIIAADTAKFGQPEVRLGVAPGMGGTQRLPRAVGKSKAMDMCLSARLMDAIEAERIGLVSRVVPAEDLIDEALSLANAIAAMPPLAIIAIKELVNASFDTGLGQGLLFERRMFAGLTATQDKAEGMAAFVEKRPANWVGR